MSPDSPSRVTRSLWPLLLMALLILLTAIGGESARLVLRYDKVAVEAGEAWRLFSGHFVHLGWPHTLLNFAGLALVGLLFPREYRAGQWSAIAMSSLVAISAWFVVLRPDLSWYVGLSGVLHGLFVAGALHWLRWREPEGYLLAAFLVVKLAWEQLYGALPLSVSTAGGPVVVDAHLAGALGGALAAVAVLLHDWTAGRR